jgi:hypothetical protein
MRPRQAVMGLQDLLKKSVGLGSVVALQVDGGELDLKSQRRLRAGLDL